MSSFLNNFIPIFCAPYNQEVKQDMSAKKTNSKIIRTAEDALKEPSKAAEEESRIESLISQAKMDQIEKMTVQFIKNKRQKNNPLKNFNEAYARLETQTLQDLKTIKNFIQPEIERIKIALIVWEESRLLLEKTPCSAAKDVSHWQKDIESEIQRLKKDVDALYKQALKETKNERNKGIYALNQASFSDRTSRSLAKGVEIGYKIGSFIKKPPEDVDESIKLALEANKIKNDIMTEAAALIADPKKSLQKGWKSL